MSSRNPMLSPFYILINDTDKNNIKYYHDDDGWWNDFGRLQDVIAWCEPKFEEETND